MTFEKGQKAVGYLRVSTQDQVEEGLSLEMQERRIRAYCEAQGFVLIRIFKDEGISGSKLSIRPGVQEAIEVACEEKAVLVFLKLDRLARSVVDAIHLAERLKKCGAHMASIEEKIDTTSAMGEFIYILMSALSQLERKTTAERTKSVLRHKRDKGEVYGQAPYGFERGEQIGMSPKGKATHALVECGAEQGIMEMIRELREDHSKPETFINISARLNNLGLRTRRGTLWKRDRVWEIYKIACLRTEEARKR